MIVCPFCGGGLEGSLPRRTLAACPCDATNLWRVGGGGFQMGVEVAGRGVILREDPAGELDATTVRMGRRRRRTGRLFSEGEFSELVRELAVAKVMAS